MHLPRHQQKLTPVAQGTECDATNVEVEVRVLAGVLQEHAPPVGATDARETANPSASGADDTAFDARASDAGCQEQQRNPMPVGPDRHGHRTLNPETEVRILDGQHGPRGGTEDARGSDPRAHTGMQVQLLPGARMILEGVAQVQILHPPHNLAPVVQRTRLRPPKAAMQVRLLLGARAFLPLKCNWPHARLLLGRTRFESW